MEQNKFINLLIENNWKFTESKKKIGKEINHFAKGRLKLTNPDFIDFIRRFKILSNSDDNIWFVALEDYATSFYTGDQFSWNEYEVESLKYAEFEEDREEILKFWNNYLPFLYSTKNQYSYLAIKLKEEDKGCIVYGTEPEYEKIQVISDSFESFLDIYSDLIKGNNINNLLVDFL